MARKKIALIGGGQIGGNLALLASQKELGDVVIYDIPQAEGMTKGKALDLMQLLPHGGYDGNLEGTSNPADLKDSDVVIITAGIPRKPGMNREDLLKHQGRQQIEKIPFVVTYNQHLPNLREAINKHWDILQINSKFKEIFEEKPIIAYKRNVNLGDMIGQKNLKNGKVIRRKPLTLKKGSCKPCLSQRENLCCKQIHNTSRFSSTRTKEEFEIFHHQTLSV